MQHRRSRPKLLLCLALLLFSPSTLHAEQPSPAALAAFASYVSALESRLAHQHASPVTFLAPLPSRDPAHPRLQTPLIERLTPAGGIALPGALLNHWRGSVFVPNATPEDFDRLMRAFDRYPAAFAPQVLEAKRLTGTGDHLQALMRVRQHHVLTAVFDIRYELAFGHLDPQHGFLSSRSIGVTEIASPGTASEHPLSSAEDHGFLWRLNSYWTCVQQDGGLSLQLESVTLTRSVPRGLGWAVGPYLETIPRESLEFTLGSVARALQR